jgi:hypothetical protein
MKIAVKLAFDEKGALRLLNWLAQENAIIVRAQPELPLLYDSGVVYRRELDETWCDYLNMLAQGHEDCDGLAAARAGELIAKGWRALSQGDQGSPGLYHCIVRYRVGRTWHRDDPSARLGMHGGRIDPLVKQRWSARAEAQVQPERSWRTA